MKSCGAAGRESVAGVSGTCDLWAGGAGAMCPTGYCFPHRTDKRWRAPPTRVSGCRGRAVLAGTLQLEQEHRTAPEDRTTRLWDATPGAELARVALDAAATALAMHDDCFQ